MKVLVLRRASISRPSGSWSEADFDVFDGGRGAGRIKELSHPLRVRGIVV